MATKLRIVRLYLADLNFSLPLDQHIVWEKSDFMTDLDDSELLQETLIETPIKQFIDAHNERRIKVKDKTRSTKDNEVFLEPARMRDLNLHVVTIASF